MYGLLICTTLFTYARCADGTDDIPGARYLETAPLETEWEEVQRGEIGTDIPGADNTAVGTGMQNKADIVEHLGADSEYASVLCAGLSVKKCDDWFLSSKDKLHLMYEVLSSDDIVRNKVCHLLEFFGNERLQCWVNFFHAGQDVTHNKELKFSVRAVRAF